MWVRDISTMAPRTRLGEARAAAAAEATSLLLDLSHDEVSIVTHELCDPFRPLLAVHLHGLFTLCKRLA